MDAYRTYRISAARRASTIEWLTRGLASAGCRILHGPKRDVAPFRIVFEAPDGERIGALIYLFTITCRETRNRPSDECRFQIKYGQKDGLTHELWQDPNGLYTTVFLGIEPETGCFVAADPVLHSPTLMFISLEFKRRHLIAARESGWHVWERESTIDTAEPTEVLVGGRPERLLDVVRFERAAKGLDQGHRQMLAERMHLFATPSKDVAMTRPSELIGGPKPPGPHELAAEFQLSPDRILDLVATSPRLKMAVRGWVAEDHLVGVLRKVPGVSDCARMVGEGKPDIQLRFRGSRLLYVECKNVLRQKASDGSARVDFQRTRASIGDPCTRYYRRDEFDVLAACLHATTERWDFRYRPTSEMTEHKTCPGRLSQSVRIDGKWHDAERALAAAVGEA